MRVYNVSTPALSEVCNQDGSIGNAGYVQVNGVIAGVASGFYDSNTGTAGDFSCFDLSSPENPLFEGYGTHTESGSGVDANGFDLLGEYAVVANGNSWFSPIYDMSLAGTPPEETGYYLDGGAVGNRSVNVCGEFAYRLGYYSNYFIDFFNISDFTNISSVYTYNSGTDEVYAGIKASTRSDDAQYLFIPASGGLDILDISSHEYPSLDLPDVTAGVRDIAFGELADGTKLAVLAATDVGILILDISELPSTPTDLTGEVFGNFTANSLDVSGDYVYVASGTEGVTVVDISDPALPIVVCTIDTAGTARDVSVQGRYLYVADNDNGLVTIDLLP
jgi:hypothetical protein